jgi:hypothetical protein
VITLSGYHCNYIYQVSVSDGGYVDAEGGLLITLSVITLSGNYIYQVSISDRGYVDAEVAGQRIYEFDFLQKR